MLDSCIVYLKAAKNGKKESILFYFFVMATARFEDFFFHIAIATLV